MSLPAGASRPPSDGLPPQFDDSPDMGGFSVSFFLPFERLDVYNELLSRDNPLGSSPNAQFKILRPGYTEGMVMSPGCVRRVVFGSPNFGETVSELTAAEPGPDVSGKSFIKWRQLHTATRMNLLGRGHHPVEFIVELEGGQGGTLITLRYNFESIDMKGPLFCIVSCLPQLLKYQLVRR